MIFRPELARQIRAGRKTTTRRLTNGAPTCRYKPGKSYAVQPGRGQTGTCRIYITSVHTAPVGHVTLTDALQEGFRTTDEFKTYWVSLHDKAWLEHENTMLDEAENDDGVILDRDTWIMRRSVHMFDLRHAHRPVWVITFHLDNTEQPRFLGASSPLVDGGKARLMSAHKVKPRPARPAHNPNSMSEDEASGYVTTAARGVQLEAEPVSRETQERITERAGMTTQQWTALEQAGRDRDRALLSREDQLARLQRSARLRAVDISRETWALQNMLNSSTEERFIAKVRKTERRVFQQAA